MESMNIVTRGNLRVNKAFADLLRRNGLYTFESFMQLRDIEIVKHAIRERSTARLTLQDGRSRSVFYLKRHAPPPLKEYLKQLTRLSFPKTALDEWRAIIRFHELGLPTMVPVAAGGKAGRLGPFAASFLLTEEIKNAKRLDHYLEQGLAPALSAKQFRRKRAIIDRLAGLTRKMHLAGLNHRDYYLCHILIREIGDRDEFELFVVDLHRVDIAKKVSRRLVIKDLAALNYSSLNLSIHTTDRMRFLKRYLQTKRLGKRDLHTIKQVSRKTKKIAEHTQKRRSRDKVLSR